VLFGRLMRADKQEYDCETVEVALGGLVITSDVRLEMGEPLIANFDLLGSVVGRAKNGVFLLQAIEIDSKPLKAWDQLKPLVEGAYFTEEAKKQAEEKRKAMEAALLRLAKEKLKDKVAEIEGKKQARIDEKVAAWEKQLTEDVAGAEAMLAKPGLGQLPRRDFEAKRDSSKRRLEGKVEQTKAFENEVTKLIEREIARAVAAVAKLRARGVRVVFVRAPSSGEVLEGERRRYPREKTWDLLLARTGAPGIHFEDHPDMQELRLPEWSHLAGADADRWTAALHRAYAALPDVQR
jgi:hypothetical protein